MKYREINYKEMNYNHTDLALELQEEQEEISELSGVKIKKVHDDKKGVKETIIDIINEEGAQMLGKPIGTYITLEEGDKISDNDKAYHREMSICLAKHIKILLSDKKNVLFVGLGNGKVTPDALGPKVMENLFITNHLVKEGLHKASINSMAIQPGVMAQTGMETGDIIRGIVKQMNIDAIIVVDALAAKTMDRLNSTIQISDAGISPGAGVRNKRAEITKETMGIPVIAIGVPTVISIPAIANDIMEDCMEAFETNIFFKEYEGWTEEKRYYYLSRIINEKLFSLIVTPKDIDEDVKRISFTISEGLNMVIDG